MKSYFSLTVSFAFLLVSNSCEPKTDCNPQCNEIELNKPFTARIGEDWCIPESAWKIHFDSVVDDSRCNAPDIDCIWGGMYVMSATIDNGDITQDTFFAIHDWKDTIYSGPYAILLNRVHPTTATPGPSLPETYSFEMLVK